MPQFAYLSVVFMMAFVMLFDKMHRRHRRERLAPVLGAWLFDAMPRGALNPRERANRLYGMGELSAAAEVLRAAEE